MAVYNQSICLADSPDPISESRKFERRKAEFLLLKQDHLAIGWINKPILDNHCPYRVYKKIASELDICTNSIRIVSYEYLHISHVVFD